MDFRSLQKRFLIDICKVQSWIQRYDILFKIICVLFDDHLHFELIFDVQNKIFLKILRTY